jgi:hypothetical protein
VWVAAVALVLTGCAGGRIAHGTFIHEAKGFVVTLPPAHWTPETGDGPDLLLRHASRQAGISIHGTCGGTPPDRPLEIASRHLFFGLRETRVVAAPRRVPGRSDDALEVVLRGELQQRDLLVHGYTVRGADCLYDLVLFAAPEDYAAVDGEFQALVRGFRRLKAVTR